MSNGVSFSPPPADSPDGSMVAGEEYWPQVDVNHFRDVMRIGGTTIAEARMKNALLDAMLTVGTSLAEWQAEQVEAGYDTLATVPSPEMGDETRLTMIWRRAVYNTAAADLAETHADLTATPAGANRDQETYLTAGDYRRAATRAVRQLQGKSGTRASLI